MNFYRYALKLKWLVGWAYFKLSILQGLLPWWLDHRHHIPSQTGTLTTTYPTSLSPLTWRCRMPVTRKLTTMKESNPFHTSARIIHLQDRRDLYSSKEYLLLQENGTLRNDSLLFSGTSGRVDGWMYGWTYGWMTLFCSQEHLDGWMDSWMDIWMDG